MQVKLNLQIFVFIILFILTHQIQNYSIVMLFAFLHECGHLFAGVLLKFKPKSLQINPFGLAITFESYKSSNKNNLKAVLIALAGPFTNFLIITITYFLKINNSLQELIFYSNLLIILFNMLPIYPLDGGRTIKGILKIKNNDNYRIDEIVNRVSYITVIIITATFSILILSLKNIALLFIIIYIWSIIIKENKKYRLKKSIYDIIKKEKKYLEVTDDKK